MEYKLICSDIDGTLLNKDRALSTRTIKTLQILKDRIPVVLVSARMPKAMRHLQNDLNILHYPIIAYNGGLIIDYENGEEVLFSETIPLAVLQKVIAETRDTGIHLSLYHEDEWYVPAMDYWALREENNTKASPEVMSPDKVHKKWEKEGKAPHKIMCMGDANEIQVMFDRLLETSSDDIHLYRSKDTYIEIASKSISKLTALDFLAMHKYAGVKLDNIVAFGDNYNDEEMVKGVGYGVAVENARDVVKAVADRITLSNKEDGVAIALEELFDL